MSFGKIEKLELDQHDKLIQRWANETGMSFFQVNEISEQYAARWMSGDRFERSHLAGLKHFQSFKKYMALLWGD